MIQIYKFKFKKLPVKSHTAMKRASPGGSDIILVHPHQMPGAYSPGNENE